MFMIQVKTEDFEVIGTNKHRDDKNVAWNDAVEILINSELAQISSSKVVNICLNYRTNFILRYICKQKFILTRAMTSKLCAQ